eukprot:1700825-Alexandrium_andersonii.AAC.1
MCGRLCSCRTVFALHSSCYFPRQAHACPLLRTTACLVAGACGGIEARGVSVWGMMGTNFGWARSV